MKEAVKKFGYGQLAGILFGVAALALLVFSVLLHLKSFNLGALLMAAALGFLAVMLYLQRRDMMLLAAAGAVTLMELLFGGLVGFVGFLLLLFVVLVMATPYLPQAKALVCKLWYVPAIVIVLSEIAFIITPITLVFSLGTGGGALLCCKWLTQDETAAPAEE